MLTLTIQNLRGLKRVEWQLDPVTCVIGPNGAGKTTLVLAVRFLRAAWDRDIPFAVGSAFRTHVDLRHRDSPADEPIVIELKEGTRRWLFSIQPGDGVWMNTDELLTDGDETVVYCGADGRIALRGTVQPFNSNGKLATRLATDFGESHPSVAWAQKHLSAMHAFYNYRTDLIGESSPTDMNRHLASDGRNVGTMLRHWLQTREDRFRFDDVMSLMKEAFPEHVADIDFAELNAALAMRFYRPGDDVGFPAFTTAQGHLSLLVTAAAVVSIPRGGVVAIDEPEFALHPSAIGVLIQFIVDVAQQRGIRVLITTHSPVVLNALDQLSPGSIWRLRKDAPQLLPLEQDHDEAWLAALPIGRRLELGALGKNDDP
jgi:hypothetical protein